MKLKKKALKDLLFKLIVIAIVLAMIFSVFVVVLR